MSVPKVVKSGPQDIGTAPSLGALLIITKMRKQAKRMLTDEQRNQGGRVYGSVVE